MDDDKLLAFQKWYQQRVMQFIHAGDPDTRKMLIGVPSVFLWILCLIPLACVLGPFVLLLEAISHLGPHPEKWLSALIHPFLLVALCVVSPFLVVIMLARVTIDGIVASDNPDSFDDTQS